jgi:predicted nucleotidyltransferase
MNQETQRAVERWERAWEVARVAANLLRERFGATRVVVFGSLTDSTWFTPWSDIDVAAWGISAGEFYRAVAVVTGLSPEFEIDLVDPETCRPSLRRRIEREGIEV